MKSVIRSLIVCFLFLAAVPSFGMQFTINGFLDDFSVDACDGLEVNVKDVLSVPGFRQETYTLFLNGSAIASEMETFVTFGNVSVDITFHVPTVAGAYQVKRSGLGSGASFFINVGLAPGLDCPNPVKVTSFGEDMWFEGNDWTHKPVVGDFDNDFRLDDIAYRGKCGTGTECWRVHLGNGSSFTTANFGGNIWFQGSAAIHAPVAGDFDQDGFVDDIAYYGKCGSGNDCWRVHLSDGSSFSTANFGAGMWFQGSTPANAPVVGDFDGDEYFDDIAYWGACGSGGDCWRVHLSNGSSFTTANFGANMWFEGADPVHTPITGDFDNDNIVDDIAYYGKCGSGAKCWRVHQGNTSSFTALPYGASMWFYSNGVNSIPLAGEIDNDGRLDDIVYFGKCGSGFANWRQHLSNGSTFNAACGVGPTNVWFEGSNPRNAPMIGDFDNDGEHDDIVYYGKCGSGSDCWRVHIWP